MTGHEKYRTIRVLLIKPTNALGAILKNGIKGAIAGAIVGWLPGFSSGTANKLCSRFEKVRISKK